jgi:hypothetical protein
MVLKDKINTEAIRKRRKSKRKYAKVKQRKLHLTRHKA